MLLKNLVLSIVLCNVRGPYTGVPWTKEELPCCWTFKSTSSNNSEAPSGVDTNTHKIFDLCESNTFVQCLLNLTSNSCMPNNLTAATDSQRRRFDNYIATVRVHLWGQMLRKPTMACRSCSTHTIQIYAINKCSLFVLLYRVHDKPMHIQSVMVYMCIHTAKHWHNHFMLPTSNNSHT